ncbi:hypothetical protein HMJ29_14200 [Hymenobacter taeanensis]|uniref:Photosynthesis system II assembly factor Ycf48/Hcf136-like domain-containing protein n=1 Tax=Hymenobacter taeanensis TaxID=2735321 RepID=A0A6M6BIR6_9BACT|nr:MULTISPECIES: hypothetical protein [Hymenobacter]QJX48027.1 hypothetical protein HMJ29_14200 [Hymenobacter taeanensis]UOQ82525.1 hypothetical protein MUN83_07105 [Hymenobacter sp. 5414T-23]
MASITLPVGITSIFFLSESTGLATTYEGKIYRTQDQGATWLAQYIPALTDQPLFDLLFTDQKTGYAVGGKSGCGGAGCVPPGGIVLKTDDGGATWHKVYTGSQNEIVSIAMNKNGSLFIAANGSPAGLFRSTDAGFSWQLVETAGNSFSKIVFTDNAGFYTGGGAQLVKSTDAGATWPSKTVVSYNYVNDLAFSNERGYYVLGYSQAFTTYNTGASWQEVQSPVISISKVNSLTVSSALLWGGGHSTGGDFPVQYAAVGQTTNGGKTWTGTEFPEISRVTTAHFYTPQQGYAVAGRTLLKVTVK